jgi:hypothetical protein
MKRLFSAKPLIAAALALGAIGATSVAQARDDFRDFRDQRGHDQRAFRDADRDGIPNLYDRDSRLYDHRAARRHAQWGDSDRDGVVNAYDRAPNNPRRH